MENICDLGGGKVFLGYKKYTSKKNSKLECIKIKSSYTPKNIKKWKGTYKPWAGKNIYFVHMI